ncbi:ABC transporter ATP-binding protein [Olivibacter sitiensis]|uniref:ABC transporter ATP-binding protein n=1 Tax=Olivibacter sitiensis TaxID=376470 RepID=UPI000419F3AE|nr:ABC transporter ATP-binding protein [Olivibacter sitiensis]
MSLKQYLPFIKPFKQAFFITPVLVIIDVVCEVLQPRLMSDIVDVGIKNSDLPYVYRTGGLMVLLSVIAILANIGNIYYSSRASVGSVTHLRNAIFRKIQSFSFADIDRFSSASLSTRITNDTNILQQVLMMSMRLMFRAPFMLVFAVLLAITINAELALILAFSIPVLGGSIYYLLKKGLPYFAQMQQRLDRLNGIIQENLTNVRVVKSFVRQDYEKKKFGMANEELMEMAAKASGVVIMILPVMQLIMNLSIVAVVWFGGNKIIGDKMEVGQFMSFISYIIQILISLMMLSMTLMMLSRAAASSKRVLEVLDQTPSLTDGPEALRHHHVLMKGGIAFRQVWFRYNPDNPAYVLRDISFEIRPHSTVAIIGATGAAKSSLVQLIPRLYDATKGAVLIDGIPVKDYTLKELRGQIAMVLQKNELFSGTIYDNLRWGDPKASEEEMRQAAEIAQADAFIRSFPQGYHAVLGQGGVNISGGQKQRLCIARAILKKPKILILDDSTSAVDTATEMAIREGLKKYLTATTVIIIAQRISSIMHADQIIVLEDGQVVAKGTHEELLRESNPYQEIYYSQVYQTKENEEK